MTKILNYLLDRMKEPSSVRGAIWLVSALGLISKNNAADITSTEGIVAMAMLIAGIAGIVLKDRHTTVVHAGTVERADNVEQANTVIDSEVTNSTIMRGHDAQ